MKCVVLVSGGMDSATVLGIAHASGYEIYALSFKYGQRHHKEIKCAKKLTAYYNAKEHRIMEVSLDVIGGSALTDTRITVPQNRAGEEIPVTYVPARNLIFLSIAGAYAEVVGAEAIFIGANEVDFSGYPDCREAFLTAFEEALATGTKAGVEGRRIKVLAPLLHMSKVEIVKKGMEIGVPYQYTWSCYVGGRKACGKCDACKLRLKGFEEAGYEDPIEYEH